MLPKDLPGQVRHVLTSSTMRDLLETMAERIESQAIEIQLLKSKVFCEAKPAATIGTFTKPKPYPGMIVPKERGFTDEGIGSLPAGTAAGREKQAKRS